MGFKDDNTQSRICNHHPETCTCRDDIRDYESQLPLGDVIKSLPDSEEIRMKARELDEKDFDQWWWETVYKGNVL
jgi:hypothetical protein